MTKPTQLRSQTAAVCIQQWCSALARQPGFIGIIQSVGRFHCKRYAMLILAVLVGMPLVGCRWSGQVQRFLTTETPTITTTPSPTPSPTVTLAPTLAPIQPYTATPQRVTLPTLAPQAMIATPTLDPTTLSTKITPRPGDHARWIGVEPVDYHRVEINGEFRLTFRFLNTGTTVWNEEYRLVFDHGTVVSGRWFVRSPRVLPGEVAEISVWALAPHLPETYDTTWKLVNPAGDVLAFASHRFRAVLQ